VVEYGARSSATPATRIATAFVVAATERVLDFRFERLFHDLPNPELHHLGQHLAIGKISEQLTKPLTRPLRCRDSARHGDSSSLIAARRRFDFWSYSIVRLHPLLVLQQL